MTDHPVGMTVKPQVEGVFDAATDRNSPIVRDTDSDPCATVDSVMGIAYAAGRITHGHADGLFICHDDGPNGRTITWETTVADENAHNIHVGGVKTREDFIGVRTEGGGQLGTRKLIIPFLQGNMRAGKVPKDREGMPMMKVPLNGL